MTRSVASCSLLSTAPPPPQGRVFIIEQLVPGPDTPHVAKLFDLHMLILLTGRERTLEEYTLLLADAGWTYRQTWYPASKQLGVVEGVKASPPKVREDLDSLGQNFRC